MNRPVAPKAVADAIADADRILRAIDTLSSAERVQITNAIKVDEQQIGDVTWTP
jgi:hypothetical protein